MALPSDTLIQHFTTEFSGNWTHRAQQTGARLDAFVIDESYTGERKRYSRIGSTSSRRKTERKAPTTAQNVEMDFRWAYRAGYDLTHLLDEDDSKNLGNLVLPTGDLVRNHVAAFNRDKDDTAISTALGSVYTGEAGTTETVYDSNYSIAHGSAGLTVAKLLEVIEIMNEADLDDMNGGPAPRVFVCGPRQNTNLLNTTEVKSADYNTVKALAAGQIDTFMGFKFVINNRLAVATSIRTCVAWAKGAIIRTVGEKQTRISVRNDLSDSLQIRSTWDLGGTRVCDEGVVRVYCSEA